MFETKAAHLDGMTGGHGATRSLVPARASSAITATTTKTGKTMTGKWTAMMR